MTCRFRVGDQVRAVRDSNGGGYTYGKVYTIKDIYEDRYDKYRVVTEIDDFGSTNNGWAEECFELARPATPFEQDLSDYIQEEMTALGLYG